MRVLLLTLFAAISYAQTATCINNYKTFPEKFVSGHDGAKFEASDQGIVAKQDFVDFCREACCEDSRCKSFHLEWGETQKRCFLSFQCVNELQMSRDEKFPGRNTLYVKLDCETDICDLVQCINPECPPGIETIVPEGGCCSICAGPLMDCESCVAHSFVWTLGECLKSCEIEDAACYTDVESCKSIKDQDSLRKEGEICGEIPFGGWSGYCEKGLECVGPPQSPVEFESNDDPSRCERIETSSSSGASKNEICGNITEPTSGCIIYHASGLYSEAMCQTQQAAPWWVPGGDFKKPFGECTSNLFGQKVIWECGSNGVIKEKVYYDYPPGSGKGTENCTGEVLEEFEIHNGCSVLPGDNNYVKMTWDDVYCSASDDVTDADCETNSEMCETTTTPTEPKKEGEICGHMSQSGVHKVDCEEGLICEPKSLRCMKPVQETVAPAQTKRQRGQLCGLDAGSCAAGLMCQMRFDGSSICVNAPNSAGLGFGYPYASSPLWNFGMMENMSDMYEEMFENGVGFGGYGNPFIYSDVYGSGMNPLFYSSPRLQKNLRRQPSSYHITSRFRTIYVPVKIRVN